MNNPVPPLTVGPKRIINVEANFVISLMHAVVFPAKVRNVADPHDSIKRNVFVVDFDDR